LLSIAELLNRFEPDPDVLLRAVSAHVSDEMLEWIATADYGDRADEHLVALRQVRDSGTFPERMYWCPMEVLELIRWSEPEDPEWKPGRTGEFGHWMRAFSCAAILRAEHEPYNYKYNDGCVDSTVVQLIQSLRALPVEFASTAASSLAWSLLHADPDGENEQIIPYGVGLLWFALQLRSKADDSDLAWFAQWVIRRADAVNSRRPPGIGSGLRDMVTRCQKQSAWERFGLDLSLLELKDRSSELRVWVNLIGEQLLEGA
jgi:hypothetical protein